MDDFNSRIPGYTMPAGGELTWGQKNLPIISLISDMIMGLGVGLYFILDLGVGTPEIQISGVVFMLVFPIAGLFVYFLLTAALQRHSWPVSLYDDGFEAHQFTFDRLAGAKAFVPVSEVTKVSVDWLPDNRGYQMSIVATRKMYAFGQRSENDIRQAVRYIRKEWPDVPVLDDIVPAAGEDAVQPVTRTAGKARKVAVRTAGPVPRFCTRCGAEYQVGVRYCPACGLLLAQPGASSSPAPPAMPPAPYYQAVQQKDPRTAFFLGLLPGLVGLMGLGHFYTKHYLKGVVLLVVGVVLALFALASLIIVLDPSYGAAVNFITFAIGVHAVFFTVLAWSSIDAKLMAVRHNESNGER